MRHRLSTTATRDVARLYRQSVAGFGVPHANRYLARLESTFELLADFPESSSERTEYARAVRIYRFESHHIIYRIAKDELIIVRVLHGRQDIARYL